MNFELSLAQKEIYNREIYYSNTSMNNNTSNIVFKKDVTYEQLNNCLNETVRHFSTLRIQICNDGEKVMQYNTDYSEIQFPMLEFVSKEDYLKWADQKASECIFDYDSKLYRYYIVYIAETKEWSIFSMVHHILVDASGAVIVDKYIVNTIERELGNAVPDEEDYDYKNWVEAEKKYLGSKSYDRDMEYWNEMLSDYDGKDFIVHHSPENIRGNRYEVFITTEETDRIRGFCQKYSISIPCFFYSVFALYKSRFTRSKSTAIGIALHNRSSREKVAAGMFVSLLPLIIKIDENMSVADFVTFVKTSEMKFLKHHRSTYGLITEHFPNQEGLLDLGVSYQTFTWSDMEEKGYSMKWYYNRHEDNFALSVGERYGKEAYLFEYDYSYMKFNDEDIKTIHKRIMNVVTQFISNPDRKLDEIEIISDDEKKLILNEFNATRTDVLTDKTIPELFEEQVKKTPDNIAVIFGDKKLTYSELNAKVNALANKLRNMGVKPDDMVAMFTDRSIEMIAGIYAVIKAGGAYVPIDPSLPAERIKFMLGDCKPKFILKYTNKEIPDLTQSIVVDIAVDDAFEGNAENPEIVSRPNDLAYCIYTSGTTGTPKGTLLEHHGIVNLKYYFASRMGINENDSVLQFANYVFDASVWEMNMALLNGAKLVCMPGGLAQSPEEFSIFCKENGITVATLPPNYYIQDSVKLNLRLLITAGSESSQAIVNKSSNYRYINAYGPTETTVCASHWECEDKWNGKSVPIGRPIDNFRIYILNEDHICGIGMPGELCIAGDGLARGYLNRSELTAEKFVNNPFGEGRMYRSGDLARWLPDGNIEYLGRIDEQVKIRGFRIELGEIESRLREIENVNDCTVIVRNDSSGDKMICAYFTSDIEVNEHVIKEKLGENLPDYMVPAYIMQIDEIPVTVSGKVDKKALPEIKVKTASVYVAPRNEKEQLICSVFGKVLNVERVGIDDNYFDLGGDSIKAIRIVSELRENGYNIKASDIMLQKNLKNIISGITEFDENSSYPQGEVSGAVVKTQIIDEFENWKLIAPEHFNQAMIYEVNEYSNESIRNALAELVKHHDMLRGVYRNNQLLVLPINESKLFELYEYDITDSADKYSEIEEKCNEIQESIDIGNGPLVKAAVFSFDSRKIMMICIHHLAVDGVSWRIIKEDFFKAAHSAMQNEEINLGRKTASFIQWSERMNDLKNDEQIKAQDMSYWSKVNDEMVGFERLITGNNVPYHNSIIKFKIDDSISGKTLNDINKAYNTKTQDILITALVESIYKWKKNDKIIIGMEGHGRVDELTGLSTDRTVGWFTCVYPVVLYCDDDLEKNIINTKEELRKIPNNGVTFGLLNSGVMDSPEIFFNYLGEMDGSDFSDYSYGKISSSYNQLPGKLNINLLINNGELIGEIHYNENLITAEEISKYINMYKGALSEIAEVCLNNEEEIKTVSDLDDDIDNDDLSMINAFFDM